MMIIMKTITQVHFIRDFYFVALQEKVNEFCKDKEVKDVKVANANTVMIVYEIIV